MYISPSGNTILKQSLWFLYEKNTYILRKGMVNLEKEEIIKLDKPLKEKYVNKYIKHKDYTILVSIEWIGAPLEFLIKYNFTKLDIDTYKETIKLNRKKK